MENDFDYGLLDVLNEEIIASNVDYGLLNVPNEEIPDFQSYLDLQNSKNKNIELQKKLDEVAYGLLPTVANWANYWAQMYYMEKEENTKLNKENEHLNRTIYSYEFKDREWKKSKTS